MIAPTDPAPTLPDVATLVRATALGAATGSRSTAGVTALALTSYRSDQGALARTLATPAGTVGSALLTVGELVADKLPVTPSRLGPPALLPRAVLAAASGAGMARRDGAAPGLPAVAGLLGAATSALAGHRLRGLLARKLGTDLPGAVIEDVLAGLLAWFGARR